MRRDTFPIVEYDAVHYTGGSNYVHRYKVAVDLRWVAIVVPMDGGEELSIGMCGQSGAAHQLTGVKYEDFMRDWVRAKGV